MLKCAVSVIVLCEAMPDTPWCTPGLIESSESLRADSLLTWKGAIFVNLDSAWDG